MNRKHPLAARRNPILCRISLKEAHVRELLWGREDDLEEIFRWALRGGADPELLAPHLGPLRERLLWSVALEEGVL